MGVSQTANVTTTRKLSSADSWVCRFWACPPPTAAERSFENKRAGLAGVALFFSAHEAHSLSIGRHKTLTSSGLLLLSGCRWIKEVPLSFHDKLKVTL